jgi:hypothetical protein
MARSVQPAGGRLTITHVLFSPQATDGRRAGLAGFWVWACVGGCGVAAVGLMVLGVGGWRRGEGGRGRGPGFFAPRLSRVFSGGEGGAKKGGVNDSGKKP